MKLPSRAVSRESDSSVSTMLRRQRTQLHVLHQNCLMTVEWLLEGVKQKTSFSNF